jgi:Transposase, Mutator family
VRALPSVVKEENLLRPLVEPIVQQILEAEMDETLGAEKNERAPNRLGYRSIYHGRTLVTRAGKLELRVPQDRQGRFRTEVFERYQRSEKALVSMLAEMYVQGIHSQGKRHYRTTVRPRVRLRRRAGSTKGWMRERTVACKTALTALGGRPTPSGCAPRLSAIRTLRHY